MGCIYYIFASPNRRTSGGYIGQDSSDGYLRIRDHLFAAYKNVRGYGSEKLIQQNSACNLHFCAFTAAESYGISDATFEEFWKFWGTEGNSWQEQKLNLAEIFHIAYHMMKGDDMAEANQMLGGYGAINVQYHFPPEQQQQLQALNLDGQWKRNPVVLTLSPFNRKEDFNKLLFPFEYRTLEVLLQSYMQQIYRSDSFKKMLTNWIIQCYNNNVNDLGKAQQGLEIRMRHYFDKEVIPLFNSLVKSTCGEGCELSLTSDDIDVPDVSKRISAWFHKRISEKITIQRAFQDWKVTSDKTFLTDVVTRLTSLITDFGKSTDPDSVINIPIPAIVTKKFNINGSRTPPKWWQMLEADLSQLNFYSHSDEIIENLKYWSYEIFQDVMNTIDRTITLGVFQETLYEEKNQTSYNHSRFQRHQLYDAGLINSKQFITLRDKVRNEYERRNIHGGILQFWDIFYRQMITIWLRKVGNRALVEVGNPDNFIQVNNNFAPNGMTYYFLPNTWAKIQSYQQIADVSNIQFY